MKDIKKIPLKIEKKKINDKNLYRLESNKSEKIIANIK